MSLADRLERNAVAVETALDDLLPAADTMPERLHAAMRYAAMGGGKRLRASLVIATAELLAADALAALRVAAALEMIHAYSLIHDDLPAMDDALLRRGRTTCHREFDEATAILAGDALQALAFAVIAAGDSPIPPHARAFLCAELAIAAGAPGMCGGQMLDLLGEQDPQDYDLVLITQKLKTGALFDFACTAACQLAENGGQYRAALAAYAAAFGLAFQIRDDILDVTGDEAQMGKDLGRDEGAGKSTVISHLGLAATEQKLHELRDDAWAALENLPGDVTFLRELIDASINRTS